MLLTERSHLIMYIHKKSIYKIKVGHKNCVIPLNSFDSDPPLLCLTLINFVLTNCALTI